MGSFFCVPTIRVPENQSVFDFIARMRREHPLFQTIGTSAHAQSAIFDLDLTRPTLFLIGNETDGLCRAFKEGCDQMATIPMSADSAATSFNVGCAGHRAVLRSRAAAPDRARIVEKEGLPMRERRGIIIHPEELDATWPDRLKAAGLNVLGLHPVGGQEACASLERALYHRLLPKRGGCFRSSTAWASKWNTRRTPCPGCCRARCLPARRTGSA